MAAQTKLLVNEISKEVQRLQFDIMDMTEVCKQRREIVEKHCSQCRDLFKPWPRRVVEMYSPDNQTDEKLHKTEEKPCNFAEDKIEKQELAMLDDILAKAQQARNIQTKMSKPSKKSHSGLKSSTLPETKTTKLSQRTTSLTTEAKPKPKVSYPVLKRPPSAKSTYSTSYTKPAKMKTPRTGSTKSSSTSRVSGASNQELKKEQGKTTDLKSHETKTSTENLSKASKPENTLSKPSVECTNLEPRITKPFQGDARFLICEKGPTLSMPTEFRDISRDHRRLQRRVEKASRSFTARESEQRFIKKAEELFCAKLLSFPSVLELHEEIVRLEKEYGVLLSLIKSLVLQFASEASKVAGSLDCLERWETAMMKFQVLNQEAKILKGNLSRLSMYCPFSEHKSGFGLVFERQDCLLDRNVRGREYLKADGDGLFTYHNIKELKTLLKLSYDFKIMKYQFHLRELVGGTILPWLRQMQANHKSFVPLCRSVYSILCCEGKTFPTMVKDSED